MEIESSNRIRGISIIIYDLFLSNEYHKIKKKILYWQILLDV